MLTLKLSELVESVNVGAVARLSNADLTVSAAFRLGPILNEIQSIMKRHDVQKRRIVEEAGIEIASDGSIKFGSPEEEAAMNKIYWDFVANEEITILGEKLCLADFTANSSLKPRDIVHLGWLIQTQEASPA